ncbi:GNAT family N-acetyltransferase [Pelomonas sp. APW6]|uniref:GNAT family N-acetyltransferase n=1 Tax=Roseateles subflavus TaxID=3053353 RepID=A0ABT7LE45_9BURK|nr:GNAT family N-acetyltransferase [Pelomonas sp. APW6]MDL5030729.1 GNAT family N-acetyltransferase [Pelomonas sp. APW6]
MTAEELAELGRQAEAAGLNATSPPQESRIEGWLIRLSPGQAKRARCINALEAGTLPVEELLARSARSFHAAGLPLVVRITPFTQPPDLDARLAAKGWPRYDAAEVLVRPQLDDVMGWPLPGGQVLHAVDALEFARQMGALKGSSDLEIQAQAERQSQSRVPYQGFWLRRNTIRGWELLACGQLAQEGEWVGLYDIYTPEAFRGQGHARNLCLALLQQACTQGARRAYLQVGEHNAAALALYRGLGFLSAYRYHFRSPADDLR